MAIEKTAPDLSVLNDERVQTAIRKSLVDIHTIMSKIDTYRASMADAYKALSEDTKVPLRILRKLGGAYHRGTFDKEVQDGEDFYKSYKKVFGAVMEDSGEE